MPTADPDGSPNKKNSANIRSSRVTQFDQQSQSLTPQVNCSKLKNKLETLKHSIIEINKPKKKEKDPDETQSMSKS